MSVTIAERPLFGGAILVSARADLVDASDLRQVPDTQEVFMYPDSDLSIIVEILESVEPADGLEAVRYHFDSLAHDNDAKLTSISSTREIASDNAPLAFVLHGEQHVQKFNATTPDRVGILMGLYRIEKKNADLVVTFNMLIETADGTDVGEEGLKLAQQDFDTFVTSLRIVDYGLFA